VVPAQLGAVMDKVPLLNLAHALYDDLRVVAPYFAPSGNTSTADKVMQLVNALKVVASLANKFT